MAVAFSYIRWSSKAQGEGDSLRRQLARAQAYADAHGLELDTTHRDEGVSSMRGEHRLRGALASFLAKIEAGDIARGSYLLIDSFDRLGRENEMQMVNLMSGIVLRGVKIVTLNDNRVYNEKSRTEDLIVALISISRAHEENLIKGERVRLAHAESKRRAREEGRVWHRSGPHWLRFDEATRKFVPIPEKVAIVRRIFDLMDDGLGTSAVAQRLNEEGASTPKHGRAWDHSTVLGIAKSRTVLGEYQPKIAIANNRASGRPADGDPIPNYYGDPIIDPAQFHRVQAKIAARASKPSLRGRNTKVLTNLFTGLVVCHACRGVMGFHTASGGKQGWKRTSAFQCVNARRKSGCDHKTRYPYATLEAGIIASIPVFDLSGKKSQSPEETALNNAVAERAEIEKQIANLIELAATGSKSVAQAIATREAAMAAKDDEIKALRSRVTQTRNRKPPEAARKALQPLLAQMATAEAQELYDVRVRISEAIRSIVDWIAFGQPEAPNVVVNVLGLRYYLFDGKTGEFCQEWEGAGFITPDDVEEHAPTRARQMRRVLA